MSDKKTRMVSFRATEDEHKELKILAARLDMSLHDVVFYSVELVKQLDAFKVVEISHKS